MSLSKTLTIIGTTGSVTIKPLDVDALRCEFNKISNTYYLSVKYYKSGHMIYEFVLAQWWNTSVNVSDISKVITSLNKQLHCPCEEKVKIIDLTSEIQAVRTINLVKNSTLSIIGNLNTIDIDISSPKKQIDTIRLNFVKKYHCLQILYKRSCDTMIKACEIASWDKEVVENDINNVIQSFQTQLRSSCNNEIKIIDLLPTIKAVQTVDQVKNAYIYNPQPN